MEKKGRQIAFILQTLDEYFKHTMANYMYNYLFSANKLFSKVEVMIEIFEIPRDMPQAIKGNSKSRVI